MSDGFFEFAEDDSNAGFRLNRVELYNWGTFHNRVVSLDLKGKNGLLTGDIGSGKSTLVDAVTTLLVPAHRVAYNKAAGADFKERSLRSYVMGYYKSERSDGGFSARPVPLREAGTSHSVILGVFRNEDFSRDVTLAQVFYQRDNSGQPQRFFTVADEELSIAGEFSDFGKDLSSLKKRLKSRERCEVFDSFPDYGSAFRRRFGLKNDQALELFHQTVSLKTVGNLTSFVQEHMLEPFDSRTPIENLISHFEDLNRAHESILKAKRQISLLAPLVENLDKYKVTHEETEQLVLCRDELKYYFARLKADFLQDRITREEQSLMKISLAMGEQSAELKELRSRRDGINQAISENGGNLLESLKTDAARWEREKGDKQIRAQEYNDLARQLELAPLQNGEQFAENLNNAAGLIGEKTRERDELDNRRTEAEVDFRLLKDELGTLEGELSSLRRRKSNIDGRQIDIRRRMCDDLGLDETTFPFAGELIALNEEESAWEGAVERVLRNFALSLLVPDAYYQAVTEWADATRLKGRLVYYRVGDFRRSPLERREPDSLMNKIRLKEESPHREWLQEQLSQRFGGFRCCDTLKDFRLVSRGITRAGQIKGSAVHHEKDDRFAVGDRSRYVLGWTNRAKIAVLEKRRGELQKELGGKGQEISRIQERRGSLEEMLDRLKQFRNYSRFEELHWQPLAERIERAKREISELESQSDVLKTLQKQLKETDETITETEEILSGLRGDSRVGEHKKEDYIQKRIVETALLESSESSAEEVAGRIEPLLPEYLEGKKLYLETCGTAESEFRDKLQNRIDAARKRLDRLRDRIIGAMGDFRRDYPAETRDMDVSPEAEGEYRKLLKSLVRDNLPRFEEQFKVMLNENTIRELAGFQALLSKESQQIRERVEIINRSMHEIEYNKDRYIYLEAMNTNDMEVRDFKQEIKNCIEGALGGSEDQQYSEARFLKVKELINRFKGREGYSDLDRKWTARVTDVRNWFAFAASERWLADDSEYEHYTDSGGKSGGQKEKLAYTVLAASLAYQFGLEWGEVRSRSFRFVVIDEAFGRGSDDSARYGLNLFRKLNLQLLIITPLQKIHIIEPYVSSVGFVHNREGKNSLLRCLTIEQYRQEKEKHKP